MTEAEWEKLFDLLDKHVRSARGSWKERAREFQRRADGSDLDFEEFIGWWNGELLSEGE